MEKSAQNIQDSFLNTARKEKLVITIYLLSGVKLTGRIRSFDKYCLVLESSSQEQMIFKHAISTVVLQRGLLRARPASAPPFEEHGDPRPAAGVKPHAEETGVGATGATGTMDPGAASAS